MPTKTPRSMRTIPVPPEVLAQLGEACRGKPSDAPVATNAEGNILKSKTFAKTFAAVAEDAGVDVTLHALRKYFATTLLSSGVNPVSVAKYLGDTVETMLKTYALEQSTDADEDANRDRRRVRGDRRRLIRARCSDLGHVRQPITRAIRSASTSTLYAYASTASTGSRLIPSTAAA